MIEAIILGIFLLGIVYILYVIEPKATMENKIRLIREITEMLKTVNNSRLSEEDKQNILDVTTEVTREIITEKENKTKCKANLESKK